MQLDLLVRAFEWTLANEFCRFVVVFLFLLVVVLLVVVFLALVIVVLTYALSHSTFHTSY